MLLENKVAIITGAGTGIGEAIAHKFAREGARLTLGGLPADPVADVAETIVANGAEAEFHLGDLAEEAEARALVDLALRRFGRIDVLVSNAGIFIANAETDAYRIEDFDRTLRSKCADASCTGTGRSHGRPAALITRAALVRIGKARSRSR